MKIVWRRVLSKRQRISKRGLKDLLKPQVVWGEFVRISKRGLKDNVFSYAINYLLTNGGISKRGLKGLQRLWVSRGVETPNLKKRIESFCQPYHRAYNLHGSLENLKKKIESPFRRNTSAKSPGDGESQKED